MVYDQATGNPIAIVMELQNGQVFVSKVGDTDFNRVLNNLGVNKTVVVHSDRAPRVADFE